jgi:hypothetical protein
MEFEETPGARDVVPFSSAEKLGKGLLINEPV